MAAPIDTPTKPRKRRSKKIVLITDSMEIAKAADLVYVHDTEPGIQRKKKGKNWSYIGADGEKIKDKATIERINKLAIPPAYKDVWISPDENGHIQATGRDEKGRKQYRYHERWNNFREGTKFDRMLLFGQALPAIRERIDHDLRRRDLSREKVLAAVVSLLGKTFIRIGNREYAKDNDSYGLTTMQDDHAEFSGDKVTFTFRGKSGKDHAVNLTNKRLAKVVRACQDLPGQQLFQYVNGDGKVHAITSNDVNAYLHEIAGQEFTAKDFRTWGGTTLAVLACAELGTCEAPTKAETKKRLSQMIKNVAEQLGNTPSVSKKYYVHPAIGEQYIEGKLLPLLAEEEAKANDGNYGLVAEERVVMKVLQNLRSA